MHTCTSRTSRNALTKNNRKPKKSQHTTQTRHVTHIKRRLIQLFNTTLVYYSGMNIFRLVESKNI